jgi:chlorobactene glucosyltransferase
VDNLRGIVLFLSVLMVIELSNYFVMRRMNRGSRPERGPAISVLIPARNEEANIERCVQSVLSQDYASFEVIVLDDNSSDGTYRILSDIAGTDRRLRVMRGEPLAAGWAGKNWACHQLSLAATGDLFLFIDADTRLKPGGLRSTAGAMQDTKADHLSALPAEEVVSWGERFIVPVMHWSILCFVPLVLAYALRIPALSTSNGQFMCFTRTAYGKFGGHAAVRNSVVEDKAISSLVTKKRLKWRLLDGTGIVSCRMYQSSREAAEGMTKNLFPFFGYNIPFFVFVWIWLIVVFWQPIVTLVLLAFGLIQFDANIVFGLVAIGMSLFVWGVFYRRFRFPLYLTLLYPVTQIVISSVAMASMFRSLRGTTSWKGRVLAR